MEKVAAEQQLRIDLMASQRELETIEERLNQVEDGWRHSTQGEKWIFENSDRQTTEQSEMTRQQRRR